MSLSSARHPLRRFAAMLVVVALLPLQALAVPQSLSILHVGDQESWLLSAQGNLRDDPSQASSRARRRVSMAASTGSRP